MHIYCWLCLTLNVRSNYSYMTGYKMYKTVFTGAMLTLKAAINALHSVCHKWYIIGVQLAVPTFKLKSIEKKTSDSIDQLCDTLDYWMSNDPSPSWKHLVDALKAHSVGENRIAKEIEEKYCGPEEQSSCNESRASFQTKGHQGNIACGLCHLYFVCSMYTSFCRSSQ